ncbi:MAG: GNAT family N-acetyltransferase, partial [Candidatus Krumholzibacteria bacterium]|nr:GNAT family N-acetyltransferase [Candidatus Krumholzibacteria bacterium]
MPVALIDPISDPRWDNFVESSPKATIFHHSSWARVIAETYGYPHRYYALIEGPDITAALPFFEIRSFLTGNRWVSLPFSDRAPILARSHNQMEEILEKVTDDFSKSGCSYIEIRSGEEPLLSPDSEAPLHTKSFVRAENHILQLASLSEDVETAYSKLDTKRARWAVNRSQRDGVVIEMDNSLDAMQSFSRMNVETRRKLGAPPQPWKLFSNIHRFIIEPGRGFILMARRDGVTFGGLVLFNFGDTVTTKYSASDRRYLKYQFAHALFWEGIKWGCEHGYSIF